jgi:hypothetical protein
MIRRQHPALALQYLAADITIPPSAAGWEETPAKRKAGSVTLIAGFPLSIYAGVIVARYYAFETSVNRARSIILNMEHEWIYARLPKKIPDASSPSGMRSIYTSVALSGNDIFWQLLQIGLEPKEQGHWPAAHVIDEVAMEIDQIR